MLELKMIVITMLGMVILGDSGTYKCIPITANFIILMFLIIIMMMGTVGAGDLGNEFQ